MNARFKHGMGDEVGDEGCTVALRRIVTVASSLRYARYANSARNNFVP